MKKKITLKLQPPKEKPILLPKKRYFEFTFKNRLVIIPFSKCEEVIMFNDGEIKISKAGNSTTNKSYLLSERDCELNLMDYQVENFRNFLTEWVSE